MEGGGGGRGGAGTAKMRTPRKEATALAQTLRFVTCSPTGPGGPGKPRGPSSPFCPKRPCWPRGPGSPSAPCGDNGAGGEEPSPAPCGLEGSGVLRGSSSTDTHGGARLSDGALRTGGPRRTLGGKQRHGCLGQSGGRGTGPVGAGTVARGRQLGAHVWPSGEGTPAPPHGRVIMGGAGGHCATSELPPHAQDTAQEALH